MRISLLLGWMATVGVQTTFAQSELSLDRCIGLAMEHNQLIQQDRANLQSASASVTGAFGTFLPSVSMTMGYSRRLDQIRTVPGYATASPFSYSLGANANYTLFNGFANTATYERASRFYDASQSTLRRASQDITYQVIAGYLNVMRTEQVMRARESSLKVTREQLDRVKALFDVGSVPRANVLQQQTQEANDNVAYIQSRNDWNNARNDLVTLVGIDPAEEHTFSNAGIPEAISADDVAAFRRKAGSVQEAISRAISSRYDIESSRNRLLGDEAAVTSARSGYYPDVAFSLSYGWSNSTFSNFSDYGSTTLGLSLSLPLFDRFITRTAVQTAEASYVVTTAANELLLQQARAQVKKAYYDLESAELQLDATRSAVQSASENKRTAEERYKVGAGTVLDFITAESQYLLAEINGVNAVYGYLGAKSAVEYQSAMMNR